MGYVLDSKLYSNALDPCPGIPSTEEFDYIRNLEQIPQDGSTSVARVRVTCWGQELKYSET